MGGVGGACRQDKTCVCFIYAFNIFNMRVLRCDWGDLIQVHGPLQVVRNLGVSPFQSIMKRFSKETMWVGTYNT